MPVLNWIGKEKVVNHHLDVPYQALSRLYSFDEKGRHERRTMGAGTRSSTGTIWRRSSLSFPSMKEK